MPRSLSTAAIPRKVVIPAPLISAIVGAISAARALACLASSARPAALASADRDTPRLPPSFLPLALAAARAALVRVEIMPASSSATDAVCCSINLPVGPSIWGRSTKRTSTPASNSRDRKATERVSRSTLATTTGTRWRRALASAWSSCGRSTRRPLSISVYSATIRQSPPLSLRE